ncbi:hypothetical protein [Solicola gregarius]|uniref:Uncharacterized protein n=1 Tax=Solicola gregarius TaxID=2908642 RepID=A0AA46TL03_9ACTN|nr:hypothetical protein [Solicola gregarius]UYM07221.1 hypothetical protein L0C25_09135 [Solicola gregarius]
MRAHRIVAAVAAGFLLAGTLGAPADANVRKFRDRAGDVRGSIDITRVRVDNSTHQRNAVAVRVKQRGFAYGNYVYVYIDSNRKRRGPEFRFSGYYASEYFLHRMKSWTDAGRKVRCKRPYSLKMGGHGVTRVSVHRACIGKPGRIRVAVMTGRGGRGVDWAPAKHRWLGWVKR